MPRRSRKKRRSQSDILVSVVKSMSSRKKSYSVQEIARKSKTTWRTSKKYVDSLRKAGLVSAVRKTGGKRKKYRLRK